MKTQKLDKLILNKNVISKFHKSRIYGGKSRYCDIPETAGGTVTCPVQESVDNVNGCTQDTIVNSVCVDLCQSVEPCA